MRKFLLFVLLLIFAMPMMAQEDELVIGVLLVGPRNDQGWSQAHYEGVEYVAEQLEEEGVAVEVLTFENLNPVANPQTTLLDVVENMADEGVSLIFSTSDEFEPETVEAAAEFPEINFVHISGSATLDQTPADVFPERYETGTGEEATPNFANIMGEMEFGKMIAGCAAALTTENGQISYLGPLINAETRRLVASTYLGASYCYENYAGGDPADLEFEVIWIGFWVPTPDTLDPTQVTNTFFDTGSDVVISGIDPQDALITAGLRNEQGEAVYAVPYDYEFACDTAPGACLGIPYFDWGPDYLEIAQTHLAGEFESFWTWSGPDWENTGTELEEQTIGWDDGTALSEENAEMLDMFIQEMIDFQVANPDAFFLWEGPLNLQDGTELAAEGEFVDPLEIWYLPLLLEGISGDSTLGE